MLKIKKILFSVSLLGISLLTMVATTFAWVGIASNSVFDEFSIGLRTDNDSGPYGVQLSLSGRTGTYSESIESDDLRRQILKNLGENPEYIDNASSELINAKFAQFKMSQCTPKKTSVRPEIFSDNSVQVFEDVLSGDYTTKFIYFDVYASIYVANVSKLDGATASVPLYLRDSLISSDDIGSFKIFNEYTFPNSQIYYDGVYNDSVLRGRTITGNVRVNPASAVRVCVQRYEVMELAGGGEGTPIDYTIYQYDDYMPNYDNANDIYSFGGILPEEHNMAYQQFKMAYPDANISSIPEWQINRNDTTYKDEGTVGQIATISDGLTINTKMKFRIYFWFEGWDADCFDVVDRRIVNINLSFSNKAPSDV